MNRDKVHALVARWMRDVLSERQWSAREWAERAGLYGSAITRVINPPENEEPIIPSVETIAALARIAGSQPDLVRGLRRPVSYVKLDERVIEVTPAKKKAG